MHSRKIDMEEYFEYKNSEKKIKISFQIEKYEIENNRLQKNLSEKYYCVLKILYVFLFKGYFCPFPCNWVV